MAKSKLHVAFISHEYQKLEHPNKLLKEHFTTVEWAEALIKVGVNVTVINRYHERHFFNKSGVNYIFLKEEDICRKKLSLYLFYKEARNIVKRQSIGIIHVHNLKALRANLLIRFLFKGLPIVIQDHGSILTKHASLSFFHNKLLRFSLEKMDAIIFAAEGQEKNWIDKKVVRNSQCEYIMENSSTFYYKPRYIARKSTKMTGNPIFLWVGNLNLNKDPITMLTAFSEIAKSVPEARLYMIYRQNDIEMQVKDFILNKKYLDKAVTLIGKKERQELINYYNSADYFFSASYKEGSGYATIEALSCGVVPILSNIPSFSTITQNGKIGTLFNPGNYRMLYEKTMILLKNPIELEQQKVLKHFKTHLSFNTIAMQAKSLYEKLATVKLD